MADLDIKTFDAALIECRTQTDVIVRNVPFDNNIIAIGQETPDRSDSVAVFIDAEDLGELIDVLTHFQTQHKER